MARARFPSMAPLCDGLGCHGAKSGAPRKAKAGGLRGVLGRPAGGGLRAVRLIEVARQRAFQAVGTTLIEMYWQIGEHICRKIEVANGAPASRIARVPPGWRGLTRPSVSYPPAGPLTSTGRSDRDRKRRDQMTRMNATSFSTPLLPACHQHQMRHRALPASRARRDAPRHACACRTPAACAAWPG